MIKIKSEGIILESSEKGFDNQAVLNPACIESGGTVHMFYRAVRSPDMVSSIGYCQLEANKAVNRSEKPILFPEQDYEKMGVEDPRITFLDGIYYLLYTVYDGKNALFAYATSTDLVHFTKQDVISPRISYREAARLFGHSKIKMREKYFLFDAYIRDRQGEDILLWEKDAFLFPKKINGQFALIHRVLPGIQIIFFDDFKDLTRKDFWKRHLQNLGEHLVIDPECGFESRNVGGGCPPIETEDGWLLIYHGVEDALQGKIYHAGAALIDLKRPTQVIGRLKTPLFSPTEPWEKQGDVNNVVFPTGTVLKNDRLFIYYGAADKRIAAKSLSLKKLLKELKKVKKPCL
ncbi:MAG: pesticidal protein Cry7Aa [Candidatus Omnitrophica bacterium]|nr:pesticidal protein Cry7Aa [Candidatus Omnitrophota bacterium]